MSTTGNKADSPPPSANPSNSNPTPTGTRTLKLLQCKFCGTMIQNDTSLAIAHFRQCDKRPEKKKKKDIIVKKAVVADPLIYVKADENLYKYKSKWERRRERYRQLDHLPYPLTQPRPISSFPKSRLHTMLIRVFTRDDPVPLYRITGGHAHLPSNAWRCPVCRQRFGEATLRNQHVLRHSSSRRRHGGVEAVLAKYLPLSCCWTGNSTNTEAGGAGSGFICRRRFHSQIDLQHHRLSHTKTFKRVKKRAFRRWRKGVGKYRFQSRWRMRLKMEKRKLIECSHCWRRFLSFPAYRRHLWHEHGSIVKEGRLTSLIASYSKGYPCPGRECLGAKFPSCLHLWSHVRREHDDKGQEQYRSWVRVSCGLRQRQPKLLSCEKDAQEVNDAEPRRTPPILSSRKGLEIHDKKCHKGVKCPDCAKICMDKIELKNHRSSIHKPIQLKRLEKPRHVYAGCRRTFASAKTSKSHLASHPQDQVTRKRNATKQNQQKHHNSSLDEIDIEMGITVKEEVEEEESEVNNDDDWRILLPLKEEPEDVDMSDETSNYDPLQ